MNAAAIVGMPGSGKSEVAQAFAARGFRVIRFGDITDEEIRRRGWELNEENERKVREELRREKGMAAYAVLNLPRIESALASGNVALDGLYSWEEYKFLKARLGDKLKLVAVWSPPALRYARLGLRPVRPLTAEQAAARDYAEIENVNKGGPIAMADYTISNLSGLESLREQAGKIAEALL
jgi:dephospho-CoA kinase